MNKTKAFMCNLCQEVFAMPRSRGRPPKYCSGCKDKAPTAAEIKRQLAEERVDRLTEALEQRGLAYSQHEERT